MLRPTVSTAPPRPRGRPPAPQGGARHRTAHERIEKADADNLSAALNFSRALGLEPNLFFTIQWKHAESPKQPADRIQRFINLAGTWLRRRTGVPAVWAYCREVGKHRGEHLHGVIHVPSPQQTAFRKAARGWVEMECTGLFRATAINFQEIPEGGLVGLKQYLLKEGSDEVRREHWVPNSSKYDRAGGVVHGKRVKVSHHIGRTARAKTLGGATEPRIGFGRYTPSRQRSRPSPRI